MKTSESAQCIKLLSLKRKSWITETNIFKTNPKPFYVDINMKYSILPAHLLVFPVGLIENAFFAIMWRFFVAVK